MTKLLTKKQTAELLQVHPNSLDEYLRKGYLYPAMRTLGGHRRYDPADVAKLVDQMKIQHKETNENKAHVEHP